MKTKNLLLALFVIYWTIVYGASFITPRNFKEKYKPFFPTGYKMYAPPTTTNYDVVYDFYYKGKNTKTINLWNKLEEERKNLIWNDKNVFIKRRLYLESIKSFDFDYQMGMYKQLTEKIPNDFQKRIEDSRYLSQIAQSFRNYAKLYSFENPEDKFDSVKISVVREPIILVFDSTNKRDFTYLSGKGVFYITWYKNEGNERFLDN